MNRLEFMQEGWDQHESGSDHADCPYCELYELPQVAAWSDGWMMAWAGEPRPE